MWISLGHVQSRTQPFGEGIQELKGENQLVRDMKTILCVDTGVDDALAICYALSQEQLDLIGICASYGMATVPQTYSNTKHIVESMGKSLPVYMGSEQPLQRKREYSGTFHGMDGLGNQNLPDASAGAQPEESIDFIIDCIQRYGKQLQIITTGPMTDMAKVLQRFPQAAQQVGSVVSMAGAAITPGNSGLYAEANVIVDPEAAKICCEAGMNLTMVGLDVTRKTLLTRKELEVWQGYGTPAATILSRAVDFYLEAYRVHHPYLAGCALHDPLAVGVALDPTLVTTIPMNMTVIVDGEATGDTVENLDKIADPPTTHLALTVDAGRFMDDFYSHVNAALQA
ncbi:purine nucleosidase [Bombiscardovia nodaiensis]|uniref:Purine nucleosidase n=1 Tax=Bombiscardovia nodaiensis TaxID=2932181 RepID=A0ABM8B9B4_9BIFI|nr:purine nucleosidase [Bombiscardovia nodaiensis]